MRYYPPYFEGNRPQDRLSVKFVSVNNGKKSITLNFKDCDDRAKFLNLCKTVDIIVESFRPGVVSRLGIDFDTIKTVKPDIIYISISGYGQFGPYRDMPGHDMNYVSLMGSMGLAKKHGTPPTPPRMLAADMSGGLFGLISALGALFRRQITGEGCYADVAMTDTAFNLTRMFETTSIAIDQTVSPENEPLLGQYPWYNVYECQDGRFFSIGLIEEKFWQTFCNIPELDLAEHAHTQFETGTALEDLYDKMRTLFKTKTAADWFIKFKEWNLPGTPIQNMLDAVNDPHVKSRDLIRFASLQNISGIPVFPFPVKCSNSQKDLSEYEGNNDSNVIPPIKIKFAKLGENNDDILTS
jgi:crotonobetainyl-CoA:carnitine CoA-transferase CaiB-like acyl-CoA transferase